MNEYSVVLANDLVVKASNFGGISNIEFNGIGKVRVFLFSEKKYVAVYAFNSNQFLDYVQQDKFDQFQALEKSKEAEKYDGVKTSIYESFRFTGYTNLIVAEFNDSIYGILRDSTGLCYNFHTWIYTNPYNGPVAPQIDVNSGHPNGFFCDVFASGTPEGAFFQAYKDQYFWDTEQNDIRLIGEIASLLKKAGTETALAFQNFVLSAGVDTTHFIFTSNNTNSFSRTEFLNYKKGLELWLKLLKEYSKEISNLSDDEKLYIYIDLMYRHNMLTLLTVDERIRILKVLVEKRALMNWYWTSFDTGFVQAESAALNIVSSVSQSDAEQFLEKLISTNVINNEVKDNLGNVIGTNYICLYKMLFYRMDDYAGEDNFTKFVAELERLVLLKNNISSIPYHSPVPYTIEQLKGMTKAQFIWREKGPMLGRIKYSIISNTDTKIKFKRVACLKVALQETYSTSSVGTPIFSGFEEVVVESSTAIIELEHFDLVSIHFYDDPSFIDLSSDSSYVGKNFFTFAGFVDYILEKESTKIAEDIFNAALYVISLTVGFGEIAAAVETVNIAKGLMGILMVNSDTVIYLTSNSTFRNYIIATYPQDAQFILDTMQFIANLVGLSSSTIAASGILNVLGREQGLRFVGAGEAILRDSNALEKLTVNEIAQLDEAVKKIKNELYKIINLPESVNTIVHVEARVRFYQFPALRSELESISEINKTRFFKDFVSGNDVFLVRLEKNPKYVINWQNYTEAEKITASLDKLASLEKEIVTIRYQMPFERINLLPLADDSVIIEQFGENGLALVNVIEDEAQILENSLSRTQLGKKVLISGMVDKETGLVSKRFSNYSAKELEPGMEYDQFINNFGSNLDITKPYIQPNLRVRYTQSLLKRGLNGEGYNMINNEDIIYTGKYIGSHAEFRALNDLSIQKFGNILFEQRIYDYWLENVYGYNRILRSNGNKVIMHTCADCFYLHDIVTFIK